MYLSFDPLHRCPLDPAVDPKVQDGRVSYLYLPRAENIDEIRERVNERYRQMLAEGNVSPSSIPVDVRYLPESWQDIPDHEHGLLYLPNDYIVPGGRFNEMYGWDSYWIVQGLIETDQTAFALGMVNNFLYQIEHYGGKVLNANRTYYLSRSQPPLLARMVGLVADQMSPEARRGFLQRAVPLLKSECLFWRAERFMPETGFYRYGHPSMGDLGLCPEVRMGEVDQETGLSHYDKIIAMLKSRDRADPYRTRFYDEATDSLSKEAIASDRGVRESGFDPSMYMGYFGLETLDINPVCLNALLCDHFGRLAGFYDELGQADAAAVWRQESERLAKAIRMRMWDETDGLFYGINNRTGSFHKFKFLTSFYPLMAGIATPEQAARVRDNLALFERDHGVMTTAQETGCQWDAPNMWAPLLDFAIEGLQNYGFMEDAQRISMKFLHTVDTVHSETGAVYEKYNALSGSSKINGVNVGYQENVIGFGWTTGLALKLTHRYCKELNLSCPYEAGVTGPERARVKPVVRSYLDNSA